MNGRPLPPEHGAPVRLIVPGWYGMASVKWVARIAALTEPFDGWFQHDRYVYERRRPAPARRRHARQVDDRGAPRAHVGAARGRVEVWGWAWSGAAPIAARRRLARRRRLAGRRGSMRRWRRTPGAASRFPSMWPGAGRHMLRARARDAAGRVQPESPAWNEHGYGNNAIAPLAFYVF